MTLVLHPILLLFQEETQVLHWELTSSTSRLGWLVQSPRMDVAEFLVHIDS